MRATRLLTQPCTLVNRTQNDDDTDEYGNPTTDETTVVELCWYHQGAAGGQSVGSATEETGLAATEFERWTFYFRPDSSVQATSTVTVPEGPFEIAGPPWPARNPRTDAIEFLVAPAERAG